MFYISFNHIDKSIKQLFYNQNLICNTIETRHLAFQQCFAGIEAQLAILRIQPQAPIVLSTLPYRVQYHVAPQVELGAARAGPPSPPVPSLSSFTYNVTLSQPQLIQRCYQLEIAGGKPPLPAKFRIKLKNL